MGRMENSLLDHCTQPAPPRDLGDGGRGSLALGIRVRASNRAQDMGVLISLQGWTP